MLQVSSLVEARDSARSGAEKTDAAGATVTRSSGDEQPANTGATPLETSPIGGTEARPPARSQPRAEAPGRGQGQNAAARPRSSPAQRRPIPPPEKEDVVAVERPQRNTQGGREGAAPRSAVGRGGSSGVPGRTAQASTGVVFNPYGAMASSTPISAAATAAGAASSDGRGLNEAGRSGGSRDRAQRVEVSEPGSMHQHLLLMQ